MVLGLLASILLTYQAGEVPAPILSKARSTLSAMIEAGRSKSPEDKERVPLGNQTIKLIKAKPQVTLYQEDMFRVEFEDSWAIFCLSDARPASVTLTFRPEPRLKPVGSAVLEQSARSVLTAAGIPGEFRLDRVETDSPPTHPNAPSYTHFFFSVLLGGIRTGTDIKVDVETRTGRLRNYVCWHPTDMPKEKRPDISLSTAANLAHYTFSEQALGHGEITQPTELRIYRDNRIKSNPSRVGRFMYETVYRVPGFLRDGKYQTNEICSVYVDAMTGEVVGTRLPEVIIGMKEPATSARVAVTGNVSLIYQRRKLDFGGTEWATAGAPVAFDGKRLAIVSGSRITPAEYDPKTKLLKIGAQKDAYFARPTREQATRIEDLIRGS